MDIINLFMQKPPKVTQLLTLTYIGLTLLVWFDIVTPINLYLNFGLIFKKCQVWRLITNFFYHEEFNIGTLFQIFIFFQHSKSLEKSVFKGNAPDYIYFILIMISVLLVISPLTGTIFLGDSLAFAMLYYWARKCKHVILQILGVFVIHAPYLPWCYLFIGFLLESGLKKDLMGIFAGHLFFYVCDIMPRIKKLEKMRLKTPEIIKTICEKMHLNNDTMMIDFDIDNDGNGRDGAILF